MKKFLLFLLLFVNLHIVMTVSAQKKGVELREVVITAPKIECPYCGDSIIFTLSYVTEHQLECPYFPVVCNYCGTKVPRCDLNETNHYLCSCDGYKMECEYCGAHVPVHSMNNHYCECPGLKQRTDNVISEGDLLGYGAPGSCSLWSFIGCSQNGISPVPDINLKAGVETYVPRWTDIMIPKLNIPESFPRKMGTKDCATTALTYLFLLATPNMTLGTFREIQEYFWDYVWDRFDHDSWNDRGLNQIEKNEMFPEFGLHKVSPDEIMNSLESGNPVYGGFSTGYYDENHNWHYHDITHDDSYPKIAGHGVAIVGYNPIYKEFVCMDPEYGQIMNYPMADFHCGYSIPTNQSTHWEFNLNNTYNPYVKQFMIE